MSKLLPLPSRHREQGVKNAPSPSAVDSSLLLNELRRQYRRDGAPLDVDFRELVSWVRLGDQLAHQVHPYPAKLLPSIAHFFARASVLHPPDSRTILDPFCGSGTVALEASLAGCNALVADANPLALLITRVKTTPYDCERLLIGARRILERARRYKKAEEIDIVNAHLWYSAKRKKELEILLRAVMHHENASERDFYRLCFSVVARKLSLADPAVSVPVKLRKKDSLSDAANRSIQQRLAWVRAADVVAEFSRICLANIERVGEANTAFRGRAAAVEVGTDARSLRSPETLAEPLPDSSVPLVVTSPPYGSAQKYIRASSLALNWLDLASPQTLRILESKSIGREHLPRVRDVPDQDLSVATEYENFLSKVERKNSKRAAIARRYLVEMKQALHEMARVLSPGGWAVVVVGNNQVCGLPLCTDEYVAKVLAEKSISLDAHLVDRIKSRGLMTKRSKTASVISKESILVFRKEA